LEKDIIPEAILCADEIRTFNGFKSEPDIVGTCGNFGDIIFKQSN